MPAWLRALLMGTTALYDAPDDQGAEFEDDDQGGGEDDGGGDPPDDELEEFDDGGQDGDDEDEGQQQQPSRGNRQFGELRRNNRELARQLEQEREARIAAEARAEERRRQEHGAAEAARVAAMEPWEREQYQRDQRSNALENEVRSLRFQSWDNADRADFRAACSETPAFAKIRDKVEAEYQRIVKSGQNPTPRETIATFLIGQSAVKKAKAGGGKRVERQAAESRQRQQGVPGSSRSAGGRSNDAGGQTEQQKRFNRIKDISI